MDILRAHPGATHVFPGEWALLRTLLGDDGDAARAEVAALAVDTPVSRKVLRVADAVAAGRAGRPEEADARFAAVDGDLAAVGGRAPPRRTCASLVAPAAHADGWGDPVAWLRESLATFEASGHDALAARCRTLLKDLGAPVPRKGRGDTATVPAGAGRPRHHQPARPTCSPSSPPAPPTARWPSASSSPRAPSTSTSSASSRRPAPRARRPRRPGRETPGLV